VRVDTRYRTVIVRLYPLPEQEVLLRKCEQEVLKFLDISRLELQNMLYHKAKEKGVELSARTLALLAQRFAGSVGGKAIIPFDDNARFVEENGAWFVELQLFKGRGNRVRIPVAKTEVPYYEALGELEGLPLFITRENDDWFAYVSIPIQEEASDLVVGVDFNLRKWVVAPYEGPPLFFDAREYSDEIDRLQRLASRYQSRGEEERVRECFRKIRELVKLAHGNFLSRIRAKYGVCTLAIEDVEKMYELVEKGDKMVNNWLYYKTTLRQFSLRSMAKGFEVVEVDPEDTSRTCHKCGSPVKIYGRHKRLISCDRCGYKDYNRDLNAARNIAKRAMKSAER
jgi:transposase